MEIYNIARIIDSFGKLFEMDLNIHKFFISWLNFNNCVTHMHMIIFKIDKIYNVILYRNINIHLYTDF